jgi:very-short-patch-repair endonuclease
MTFAKMVRKGFLKTRNYSQAQLIRTDVRTHTDSTKARLREAMLDRRANGYDWTFAHSKDNQSKMSYPETFWFEVIQNEFDDKDYIFNHPFGKFSLDFAWVNKKKVIEIDGEQHYTQEEQKIRDAEKDFLLKEQGWEILRIRWKRMFNDPKPVIKLAKEFIGV